MFKIKIDKETKLTTALIDKWYALFASERDELKKKLNLYLNKNDEGKTILKMPFAKKLFLTSAAALSVTE